MPIPYSVIINQEEKARLGAFIEANKGRGVRPVARDLEKQLSSVFPNGTVVYADGSKHSLREYTEMLTATTIIDAEREATLEFVRNNPTDLVQVSVEGSSHVGCAVWEGEILSVSGSDPNFRSLDEAMGRDGLFHPRCAHDIFPVYNEEFESTKSQRVQNMETILGNYFRAATLQGDEASALAFLSASQTTLDDTFDASLKGKVVKGDVEVEGSLVLKATGEKVTAKKTLLSIGDEDVEEFDRFYSSPFS